MKRKGGVITNQIHRGGRGPPWLLLPSALKLAVPHVSERPKDDASAFIDGTPKINGDCENNEKEEDIQEIQ